MGKLRLGESLPRVTRLTHVDWIEDFEVSVSTIVLSSPKLKVKGWVPTEQKAEISSYTYFYAFWFVLVHLYSLSEFSCWFVQQLKTPNQPTTTTTTTKPPTPETTAFFFFFLWLDTLEPIMHFMILVVPVEWKTFFSALRLEAKGSKGLSWFWTARSALNIAESLKFLKSFLLYKKEGEHRLDSVPASPSCLGFGLGCWEVIILGSAERPIKPQTELADCSKPEAQFGQVSSLAGSQCFWLWDTQGPAFILGIRQGWGMPGMRRAQVSLEQLLLTPCPITHPTKAFWVSNAVLGCRKSGTVPRDLLQGLLLTPHFSTDRMSCWCGYSLIPRQA